MSSETIDILGPMRSKCYVLLVLAISFMRRLSSSAFPLCSSKYSACIFTCISTDLDSDTISKDFTRWNNATRRRVSVIGVRIARAMAASLNFCWCRNNTAWRRCRFWTCAFDLTLLRSSEHRTNPFASFSFHFHFTRFLHF